MVIRLPELVVRWNPVTTWFLEYLKTFSILYLVDDDDRD